MTCVCVWLARGGVGGEGGEWMRELGLGITNPLGTGGVLDMCFGCGGVGVGIIQAVQIQPLVIR